MGFEKEANSPFSSRLSTALAATRDADVDQSSLLPNFNLYWVGGTSLAVWFFLIHTPQFLRNKNEDMFRNVRFVGHLIGVVGIYVACIHNTLITPSMWKGRAKFQHVWIGRVGLVLGVVGFVLGFSMTWFPKSNAKIEYSFAIPITIGGILQMVGQYHGFRSIREYKAFRDRLESEANRLSTSQRNQLSSDKEKALKTHVGNMVSLFVMACGIPAMIRVFDDGNQTLLLIAAIGGMNYYAGLYSSSFFSSAPSSESTPML